MRGAFLSRLVLIAMSRWPSDCEGGERDGAKGMERTGAGKGWTGIYRCSLVARAKERAREGRNRFAGVCVPSVPTNGLYVSTVRGTGGRNGSQTNRVPLFDPVAFIRRSAELFDARDTFPSRMHRDASDASYPRHMKDPIEL